MGVGEVDGPPKKKLKQAQLPFSISPAGKSGNKRKLTSESPERGLALKVCRKEGTPRGLGFNKENVKITNIENVTDIVLLSDSEDEVSTKEVVLVKESIPVDRLSAECKENDSDQGVGTGAMSKKSDCVDNADFGSKSDEEVESIDKSEIVSTELNETEGVVTEVRDEVEEKNVGVTDELDDTDVSVQKVMNENAATEESHEGEESEETDLVKSNDNLDSSVVEHKLNQSVESDQGGPNSSIALSSDDEVNVSTPSSKKARATMPRLKKADRAKLLQEKMRLKKEKEDLRRQKREERGKKEKMKEEEKKKREEERKKREEERKKKEEERKKKEEERRKKEEAKEEEKRKKEEERKKKEEEKKKKEESKEEDRKKKEEARLAEERKENLAKMAFTKFFIQPKSKSSGLKKEEVDMPTENPEAPTFMPFPVKADMRLAVQVRHSISKEDKKILSDALESSSPPDKLYIDEIREGLRKPCSGLATWPLSEEQHDVIIVESVVEEKSDQEDEASLCVKTKGQRAKLLQFHDNRRPPYWGTWRKKSSAITPRRPFGQDKVLDYEVDSDSEWEDEEEGEDIDKEGESDKEQSDDDNVGEDGYLLDNTFVPHGYLSDEEAAEEEENLNPEDQKMKMKVLKQEFEQELKAKTRLKPRLLGCVWISNETTEVSKGSLYDTLMNLRCRWDESEGPIDPSGPAIVEDCTPSPSPAAIRFPTSLIEQLVKLVHGSRMSHINLVTEFMNSLDKDKQLSSISKRAVSLKIKEIALKTPSPTGRAVWTVSPELCAQYNLPTLEPPSVSSPVLPAPKSPLPKPKETALVNFLKKASTPSGPKRRVTPTLISPLVHGSGAGATNGGLSGSTVRPSDTSVPTPNSAAAESASSGTLKTEASVAPSTLKAENTAAGPLDVAKPGTPTPLPSTITAGNALTPPVRKRIQPITLSKTVSPSYKTPTTPKIAPIFRNQMQDTPRPPPTHPRSTAAVIDLCNDSN